MQALTIGDLERGSGVPRSTIYYYVRSGLLPPAQKASPSRGIYTDDHLELLLEIRRLKDEDGLSLEDVRQRLAPKLGAAAVNEVDLVAQQGEQTRAAILRTAAREFARKGYRQTRVSDITRQLGIRPRTLYRHFPTKRDLFAAAYVACLNAAMAVVEPPLEADPDLAVRVVWRTLGDYGLRTLNSDLLYLIREAADDDPATTRALRAAYEHILARQREDLARLRSEPDDPPVSDELLSHAVFGAFQSMRLCAASDDRFTREDVLWNNLVLLCAVFAIYDGTLDVKGLRRRYADLIVRAAAETPPALPGFEL